MLRLKWRFLVLDDRAYLGGSTFPSEVWVGSLATTAGIRTGVLTEMIRRDL